MPRESKTLLQTADAPGVPPELARHPTYSQVRPLGAGGMGVVYVARNKLLDRWEVLKSLNTQMLARPEIRERFLREMRTAAKLKHPNIVAAHSAMQIGSSLFFAMDYLPGKDLQQVLSDRGPLAVNEACDYVRQAALGLQHAYEHGTVHRDLKPGNLLLGDDGLVRILDFGLAKAYCEGRDDPGLTGEGRTLGTPLYMAPEQIQNAAAADIRADLYSLGCTLYALLSGKPPFPHGSVQDILDAHRQLPPKPLLNVPATLNAIVMKLLAKPREQRLQTPRELADALEPYLRFDPIAPARPEADLSRSLQGFLSSREWPALERFLTETDPAKFRSAMTFDDYESFVLALRGHLSDAMTDGPLRRSYLKLRPLALREQDAAEGQALHDRLRGRASLAAIASIFGLPLLGFVRQSVDDLRLRERFERFGPLSLGLCRKSDEQLALAIGC